MQKALDFFNQPTKNRGKTRVFFGGSVTTHLTTPNEIDLERDLQTGGPRPPEFGAEKPNILFFIKAFKGKNLRIFSLKLSSWLDSIFSIVGKIGYLIVDHSWKGGVFVDEKSAPHRKKQVPPLQWDETLAHKDVQT